MKKKSIRNLIILFLVAIFISIGNVEAKTFEVGQKFTKNWKQGFTNYEDSKRNHKIRFEGLKISNGSTLTVIPYELSGNGDKLLAYCIDPHLQSATEYKIDYILGASDDEKQNAIDLGVLEILKRGYSELPDMPDTLQTGLSDQEFYVATSIAIRAFAMGVGGQGKGSASNQELIAIASAHVTAGIDWLNASSYKGKLSALSVSNSWYNKDYKFVIESETAQRIMSVAESLFNIGLEAANGESSTPTITSKVSQTDTEVTVTLEYKNFTPGKGEIKNFQLKCDNCAQNKISIGRLNVSGANGKLNSKDGTIKLSFSVSKDEENCKSANFTITYDYNDPNLQFIGAHLIPTSQTNSQNFYVLQKNDDEGLKGEIKGTIKCNNACKTELATPVCADTEANAKIDGPSKIKSCIIDNVDDAGNTYQFTSSAGGVDNSYCKIYCKEDYAEIKLNPIVKDVKCGGYFKLTSSIKGTKTCYTGGDTDSTAKNGEKSIDKDKYLADIKKVQENLVDAMNRYYEFKAKSEHKKEETSDSFTCGGSDCGTKHKITVSWGSYSKVTFNWDATKESSTYKYGSVPAGNDSWTDNCACDSYDDCSGEGKNRSCSPVSVCGSCDTNAETSYGSWKSNVDTQLENATIDLGKYMKQYKQIIQDYNACTTAWSNEFAFKQQLRYYYDENRGKDGENYTPYYDLIAGSGDESLQYLEKDGEESMKTTIKICTGQATEEYECSEGSLPEKDGTIDNNGRDEYNYNGSYGSDVFFNKDYVICSVENGCVKDTRQISQAAFIKKFVEKEQKYITPTAFYQIAANGKITIVGNGYTGDKIQLEELKNALPVSTSTDGGGVFRLMIEDLGEFYDEKEAVGRLIDFNGDREENSVAYNIGSGTFDGNYKCYYESPCRPKDCPDCDFKCVGDDCEWEPCTGEGCKVDCIGCVINLDDLNIIHKTISTSNFHSAGREFGYNWITTSSLASLKVLNEKAEKTIEEIEEANETIYDNDKTTDDSALAFSIKMTPEVVNTIKEYNKAHTKDGGYINDSLTCNDVTVNGTTYKNINCYSDFIDTLSEKYSDKIIAPNRHTDQYWTTWQGYVYNEDVIGGPSWK